MPRPPSTIAEPVMDVTARRALLRPTPRPGSHRLDYVVSLSGRLDGGVPLDVVLRYVPDRRIVPADAFADYLAAIEAAGPASVEAIGVAVLEDVNDEVVPRWLQVAVTASGEAAGHAVLLEDRQPKWDNTPLLSRLRPF